MIDENLLVKHGAIIKKYAKGQTIFYEGDNANYYYQVKEGRVKMVNGNDEGKEFIQGMFEGGESFGEPPLFDGEVYPASAVADEDSGLYRLPKDSFIKILKEDFNIHLAFTGLLARRLRFKSMVSKVISCYAPEQRIAALLRHFKTTHKIAGNERFKLNYTRQQIADMTGLRVETVIRAIRQLHEKNELIIEKGKIYY